MIVGLIKPTIGSIIIEKVNIRKDFERAIAHVGAIIENPVMYDFLSGYDNLVHFFRMTNQFSNERIDEVIELLRMDDYINDKVYTYSLGMRQRLGLAEAILHQPSILLLDEPTNGLDPEGIKSLRETLRKLANEKGVSIIISSHILGEIELICDSVLVMDDGKCIERGLLSELQNGTSTKHSYSFKVLNSRENIQPILQTKYENDRIHYQTNGFSIDLKVQEVAELNKLLVAAGINVIGIERIGSPLEELFLQKLRGEET
jgi:ABC-2 type transport system ATP-binding protein